MQPYPQQEQASPDNERSESGHRGPLSRTWPQLFKKRRRYSPVRESAQQQQQQQRQEQQLLLQQQADIPSQPPSLPQLQPLPQLQAAPLAHHVQLPIHPAELAKPPSITSQSISIASPVSSLRSPSIVAETASTMSSISGMSNPPPKKVPISRRSSSIVPAGSNGAGGVTTPQADLLASKSNYQLISSGEHLEMGLHFSTAMATGVMMKRATHRAAEQARRDRMKTAMVDLAEFLLDGEVTFGSGTTCFVVMRRSTAADNTSTSADSTKDGMSGSTPAPSVKEGSIKSSTTTSTSQAGEKRTVNKARLIEMALEKMRAQEEEIECLRKEIALLRHEDSNEDSPEQMDVT